MSWADSLPGLGTACDYWAALSLERRPSGDRPHSYSPSASSDFESTERDEERRQYHKHSNFTDICLHTLKSECICDSPNVNADIHFMGKQHKAECEVSESLVFNAPWCCCTGSMKRRNF